MCSTSRGVCSHYNLEKAHADNDFIAGGYRVAVQLIVVGVHAAEGPIRFILLAVPLAVLLKISAQMGCTV